MPPLAFFSARRSAVLALVFISGLLQVTTATITFIRTFPYHDYCGFIKGIELPDHGYLICGMKDMNDTGRIGAVVIRLDSLGNVVWERVYTPPYPSDAGAQSITWAPNGGILFGGDWIIRRPDTTICDEFFARADTHGNLVRFFTYGRERLLLDDICSTTDSGSAIVNELFTEDKEGLELWKMDKDDNLEWVRGYSASDDSISSGASVRQCRDLGYIIGGNGPDPASEDVACLLKTDSAGNIIWLRRFEGLEFSHGHNASQTRDGGYVQCGELPWGGVLTGSFVWKVDSLGREEWRQLFPDSGYVHRSFRCVTATSDGGCAVVGAYRDYSQSPNIWVPQLHRFGPNGEPLWERKLRFGCEMRGDAFYIDTTYDHGFLILGDAVGGRCVAKTDSLGLVYPGVDEAKEGLEAPRVQVRAGPNPFHREVFIRTARAFDPQAALEIHDAAGRLVRTLKPSSWTVWDGKDQTGRPVPSGVYFIQLGRTNQAFPLRLVLVR
ncbi:MAG: hypothetical protein ABIK44_00120 [candidate division WOR-3 bacterium]